MEPEFPRRVVVDHLGEVDLTVNAETRHNLALQHLWNARHAARLCGEREALLIAQDRHEIDHEVRGQAMTAVISAAAFLESLVNEIYQDAADMDGGRGAPRINDLSVQTVQTMTRLWKAGDSLEKGGTLMKYQVALTSAGQPLLDPGAEPYQSADLLRMLRDRLIHFKPQWQGDEPHSVEKRLRGKLPENQQVRAGPWYPNQALSAGCAEWACNSSVQLVTEWWAQMGLQEPLNTALNDWAIP